MAIKIVAAALKVLLVSSCIFSVPPVCAKDDGTIVKSKIAELIQRGRSMERYRKDDLESAAICAKQMHYWQPKAKEIRDNLPNGYLQTSAISAILCVSCLDSATNHCATAEEWLKSAPADASAGKRLK